MQNKFLIFNQFSLYQRYASFIFLSLVIVSPVQSKESENTGIQSKASQSKFSKRKKIKKINDLRIIVDISGSMKKTDPNNLRRSAVRLLAGLVPEGSRAGIWNFGKQVNMSVKIGVVDDAWRKLAREKSKNISSAGLYTNIESVLRKASFDWKTPNPKYKRNIILLTDGHVDISKDEKSNKASRRRILKEVLPSFEKAQVRIHTIALSDDVDEDLLTTLSAYTDGLYKKVDSADDLQKLFLQMLEQSIKLDTVPIKDNKFSVDASINDMTLLIFNKDKSRPTTLTTPSNEKWKKSSAPSNVKWFDDDGYDLITIKKPQKGEWKIQAPSDPNNRVVVATNLKLISDDMPSHLILGDALNISVFLEEDGKPLVDQRLLSKFNFLLERNKEEPSSEKHYLFTKSKSDQFSYSIHLADKFKEGNNELVIQAKSPTAEREIRHQFKVYTTPADIKISSSQGKYQVEVTPHMNIMRPDTIKVNIILKDNSQHVLIKKGNRWIVDVDEKFKDSTFKLIIEAVAAGGKPISIDFDKVLSVKNGLQKLDLSSKFEQMRKTEEQHATKSKDTNDVEEDEHIDKDVKDKQIAGDEESTVKEINWVFILSSIIIGNLLLAGILGGGYVYMKRRKEKLIKDAEDDLAGDKNNGKADKKAESKDDEQPEKEAKEK